MKRTERALETLFKHALIACVLFSAALSARAQNPQDVEVQQLRDTVKQLEQTLDSLRKQISAVEDAQKKTPLPPVPAVPDAAVTPSVISRDGNQGKGTFEIFGAVALDTGYQFKQSDPDWFDVMRASKLPSFDNQFGFNGRYYASVRQSRLGFKTSTPTKYGDLKTIFDFELFGTGPDAGETTFKLRFAYGELGKFGAGQYWGLFMDIDVFPNTVEYWGPTGIPISRNVQFRWQPIQGRSFVTIALERPGASGDQGVYRDRIQLQNITPQFTLPDLSANARLGRDWGHIQLAGILRRIKWVDTVNDPINLTGSAIGWGLTFSSKLNFTPKTVGKFSFTHGKGIENYMNDAPVDIGSQINPGNATRPFLGTPIPITGMHAYVDHQWNDKFSSTAGFSFQNNKNSEGQAPDAFHQGRYASANLLWYPIKKSVLGGEFIYGRRTIFKDGFSSEDLRLQFSFRYLFSKMFTY